MRYDVHWPVFLFRLNGIVFGIKAEAELRIAQSDFDRQTEITKLLLEGVSSAHVSDFLSVTKCLFHKTSARGSNQCTEGR